MTHGLELTQVLVIAERTHMTTSSRTRLAVLGVGTVVVAGAILATQQPPRHTAQAKACGVERWAVKIGLDREAKQVPLHPDNTNIGVLRKIPAPVAPTTRVQTTEYRTFTIQATLTSYKMENDSDYHLVLVDAQARTMIAEIPSPDCIKGSVWIKQITAARKAFDAKFATSLTYQNTTTPVTVTGVGFFDKIHGQRGVANNGIELHPVLSISFK